MADHPGWLLNLVTAVERYEDTHAKVDDPTDVDACFKTVLDGVPDEVKFEARGYARGRREATDG